MVKTKKEIVKKGKKQASYQLKITPKDLLKAGCHFGHSVAKTNPLVKPFLYGPRQGVQVFDLIKTHASLQEAATFLWQEAKAGKKIVLVGTKRQAKELVRKGAEELGLAYVINRWLGGTITNWEQIKKNIRRLKELEQDFIEGKYQKRTKKEQTVLRRELVRLDRMVGGLRGLDELFDVLVILDAKEDKTAIAEALVVGIPTVALVDSNADPRGLDFPIGANDDSTKSIKIILGELLAAIAEGKSQAHPLVSTKEKKHESKKENN